MTRGTGSGITPQRIVTLLNNEVKKSSQSAVSRVLGIGIPTIHRYLKGVGEPSHDIMQKLANYFEVPVEWLRGENIEDEWGDKYGDDLSPEKVEELNHIYWKRKALRGADSPIMIEIVRCLSRVPLETKAVAFAVFRNTCCMVNELSKDKKAMIQLAEELKKLSPACNYLQAGNENNGEG